MIQDLGLVTTERTILFEGDTTTNTSGTYPLSQPLNNFDFIYVEYKPPAKNLTTQYFEPSALLKTDRILTVFGFNMQDGSPNTMYFYEHQIIFDTSYTSFTIAHSLMNRFATNNSGNFTTTTDSKDIGVVKIIGFKF